MDKKTVGAMLLIAIVIILWPFYNQLISPPGSDKPVISESQKAIDTVLSKKDSIKSAQVVLQEPDVKKVQSIDSKPRWQSAGEKELVINNDLLSAVISTKGGTLKKWSLKKYKGTDGQSVSFINPSENSNIFFTYHSQNINLKDAIFELRGAQDSINLTASQAKSFSLSLTFDSTHQVIYSYTFYGDKYHFDYSVQFTNFGDEINNSEYQLQWTSGLKTTEHDHLADLNEFRSYALLGDEKEEFDLGSQNSSEVSFSGTTKWLASRTKYFVLYMIPQEKDGIGCNLRGEAIKANDKLVEKNNFISLIMKFEPEKTDRFKIYLGPTEFTVLNDYNENLSIILEWGWAFIRPLTKAIFHTFTFLYNIIPNYGWVIIIFALVVKVVLLPLTHKSYVGMQKMKEVMPKQKEIQKKFKDNPTKMQQEMMKLYKEAGYNPLSGCLPLIIQMPLLYPIYQVFRESIDLRHAPFIGWINDLSVPDTVATVHTGLPFIGDFNVNPLPIIMTAFTFIQQKIAPMSPTMPSEDPAQKFNQKFMMYGMPIMFFFLFNNFSSGLVLYWTVFNVLTVAQQLLITKLSNK